MALEENIVKAFVAVLMEDKSLYGASHAAEAVGEIGSPTASEGIPALITAANTKEHRARWASIDALRMFGNKAKEAIPSLILSLFDENDMIRECVGKSLMSIQDLSYQYTDRQVELIRSSSGEELVKMAKDSRYPLISRVMALGKLATFGSQYRKDIPVITESLRNDSGLIQPQEKRFVNDLSLALRKVTK